MVVDPVNCELVSAFRTAPPTTFKPSPVLLSSSQKMTELKVAPHFVTVTPCKDLFGEKKLVLALNYFIMVGESQLAALILFFPLVFFFFILLRL